MGNKQEEKAEETPQIEGEKQPEPTETPQPTKEEYEAIQKELEKAKNQANTFQGLLKDAQRKSISKDDFQSLHDRIDSQQRWIATALDDIRKATGGEFEEPSKTRRSYSEDAEENITKSKESRQAPQDPAAEKFFKYLAEEKLEWESEFVQEAIKDCTNGTDALTNLKAKVKEQDMAKLRADIKKEMEEENQLALEKKLKDLGLLDIGVERPSAASKDLSSMTPDEKLQEGFKQFTKKK
jgi:hypothetical protein